MNCPSFTDSVAGTEANAPVASVIIAVTVLGVPTRIRAGLFDLDAVLTQAATVHAAAWKEMFDVFLKDPAAQTDTQFAAFDTAADDDTHVEGKSRTDGIRSFLRSRGIDLPMGEVGERSDAQTINGLSDAKNAILVRRIRRDGVQAYPGSVRCPRAVRSAGPRGAVRETHRRRHGGRPRAGGQTRHGHLPGRGRSAGRLRPAAAVFEDVLSAVDRVGQAVALRADGADVVVIDLAQLLVRP